VDHLRLARSARTQDAHVVALGQGFKGGFLLGRRALGNRGVVGGREGGLGLNLLLLDPPHACLANACSHLFNLGRDKKGCPLGILAGVGRDYVAPSGALEHNGDDRSVGHCLQNAKHQSFHVGGQRPERARMLSLRQPWRV
jgi:hypothetical protein